VFLKFFPDRAFLHLLIARGDKILRHLGEFPAPRFSLQPSLHCEPLPVLIGFLGVMPVLRIKHASSSEGVQSLGRCGCGFEPDFVGQPVIGPYTLLARHRFHMLIGVAAFAALVGLIHAVLQPTNY
jgi:hypothetical protein